MGSRCDAALLGAEVRKPMPRRVWPAALVHLLTACGAVCAFFAMRAVWAGAWQAMFAWLGLALLIDGIDGTFARLANTHGRLPRFSGERLDLVVDYLTYVFVPAAALLRAGYLSGAMGLTLCALVLLSSLYHFADTGSKGEDYCFIGFPAIWNVVAFYVFAIGVPPGVASLIVLVCVALTFVPLRWAHPLRTRRLLPITIGAMFVWSIAAALTVLLGFPAPLPLIAILLLAAAYGLGLTLLQNLHKEWPRSAPGS
jgi:phosphatidylcholine synthase